MKCFTVRNPPEIVPGIRVEYRPHESEYSVRMGKIGKLGNLAVVRLFKQNPPDVIQGVGNTGTIMDAYPVEVCSGTANIDYVLAKPDIATPNLLLIRFFMGSLITPTNDKQRASVWPETGNPTLLAYSCVAKDAASFPLWHQDSLFSCAPGDVFHIQSEEYNYRVKNENGELKLF